MEKKNSKKPFFATFLEKQIKDPETIQGGSSPILTAALEDSPITTNPLKDSVTSVVRDTITQPGGDYVTMKHPSDGDDDTQTV
ncbi:microviridin/marinostatin family tricyclic proteinase inhibitor [Chryseobacterium sp.]|uniref:microviridin/marinostatin family tricyclic proteinase inhibitor n=1 Tax=Chryseobacterium sp. TaxID=1871047 RepID=UPI00289C0267|nr:microviridin/marinostatin family tricyclic proteinase inhibitor [Chryseobacterium sp.]